MKADLFLRKAAYETRPHPIKGSPEIGIPPIVYEITGYPHLSLFIPGTPRSKQSVRMKVVTDKNGLPVKELTSSGKTRYKLHKFQDQKVENYELWLKWNIVAQRPPGWKLWTDPIFVTKLHFIFPPTKSMLQNKELIEYISMGGEVLKETKPDLPDNLNKSFFDAMAGIVYVNDAQIAAMDNVRKIYGLQPGIEAELIHINK